MDTHRKYVLRTTCTKNGGFRKYQQLPPEEVFQHAYWVLGSELEVKIKRKQILFTRKTDWMCLPSYLTTNKGLLIIYLQENSGYVLRISSATKLNFEATKKFGKKKNKNLDTQYSAIIKLEFPFGEIHLRIKNSENVQIWRSILLAAHQSPNNLAIIGEEVAGHLFKSSSMDSVLSAQSVVPKNDDTDKSDRLLIEIIF
jgi:hypothetical protein